MSDRITRRGFEYRMWTCKDIKELERLITPKLVIHPTGARTVVPGLTFSQASKHFGVSRAAIAGQVRRIKAPRKEVGI